MPRPAERSDRLPALLGGEVGRPKNRRPGSARAVGRGRFAFPLRNYPVRSQGSVLSPPTADIVTATRCSSPPGSSSTRPRRSPPARRRRTGRSGVTRHRAATRSPPVSTLSRPSFARRASAPSGNGGPLLARDHAARESTLALVKASSLACGRVRPLAWCSRPSS